MVAHGALEPAAEIRRMFDRIARRYDVMNRLMTFGRDVQWRRVAARAALAHRPTLVVDIATGTGDLAFELARQGAPRVVALDFSLGMLRLAERKRSAAGTSTVLLVCGDAMRLPFPTATVDACTIAFGLRNLPDYEGALREFARVLRPGGKLVILETTPFEGWFAPLARLYFHRFVPWLGGLVSGDPRAYSYLPRSTAAFPTAQELAALLQRAGFVDISFRKLMAGTVALHEATRGPHGALSAPAAPNSHAAERSR